MASRSGLIPLVIELICVLCCECELIEAPAWPAAPTSPLPADAHLLPRRLRAPPPPGPAGTAASGLAILDSLRSNFVQRMERVKAELTEMTDSAENSLRADSAATIEHRTRAALASNLIGERRAWAGSALCYVCHCICMCLLLHLPARVCCRRLVWAFAWSCVC